MATVHQVKVTIVGNNPPVWRRVVVPSGIKLAELHEVAPARSTGGSAPRAAAPGGGSTGRRSTYSYAKNGYGNQTAADFRVHDVRASKRMQVGDVTLAILSNHCWT